VTLAEAYEIEVGRLRRSPAALASLDPHVRTQLRGAMRSFQESVTINLNALAAAQAVIDRVLGNIGDSLARGAKSLTYGARGQSAGAEPTGQVISVAFGRRL
jgi:hypothetical protein